MSNDSGTAPATTTPTTDTIWSRGRRDGGYADEVDSWRASAEVSPPVWLRHRPLDMSARKAVQR